MAGLDLIFQNVAWSVGPVTPITPITPPPPPPPPTNIYAAGGRHDTLGLYFAPNPDTLQWTTITTPIVVDNSSTADYVLPPGNYQYWGQTQGESIARMIDFQATNGRRLIVDKVNWRGHDHFCWGTQGNGRVKITNSNFFGVLGPMANEATGRVYDKDGTAHAVFEHNYVTNMGGFRVGSANNATYFCQYNYFFNINGQRREPSTQKPIQFQGFQATEGTSVTCYVKWNRFENREGVSRVEDNVNLFHTHFTYCEVAYNLVWGAHQSIGRNTNDAQPNYDSYAGGGLLAERCWGTVLMRYNYATNLAGYCFGFVNSGSLEGQQESECADNWAVNGAVLREGPHAGKLQIHANVGIQIYQDGDVPRPSEWRGVRMRNNRTAVTAFRTFNVNPDGSFKPENQWVLGNRNDHYTPQIASVVIEETNNKLLCDDGVYRDVPTATNGSHPHNRAATAAEEAACRAEHEARRKDPAFGNNVLVGPNQ